MQTEFDTIAAISTAPGEGAIGIVRISGDDAIRIADEVYRLKDKRLNEQTSHTIHYGHIVDPKNDEVIDEVMVTVLRAPRLLRVRMLRKSTATVGLWRLTASYNSFFAWEHVWPSLVNLQNVPS